jgi:CPA2 family monovalent cation:H+ antiporter-2
MHDPHEFLKALTIVLGVAGVTTVLFQRLHQPVVLGYILAGLLVGPHVPVPLVADRAILQTLSELGVILLMFSLGLEFSISKLVRVGPTAGVTALFQSSVMLWLGFLAGRALGWTVLESAFTGALIAISSTTIIAKAFEESGVKGPLRELVVGILIAEDLIAILLLALLTAVASGGGLSLGGIAATAGRLAAFLAVLVTVGLLVVPRLMRYVNRLLRRETTLVASLGVCFGIALLASSFGYSVALGAFIAGSLVAEGGEERLVEEIVEPVRDMFAAVFFVSVGAIIDPALIARHAGAVALLTALVVLGKILGVSLGAFLTGNGVRTSVRAGMSLAQIGEFSFIIAGVGVATRATGEFLYPVAVAVSAITTLTTPWLIRGSGAAASWVDRRLPGPLQTFASLYGTWLERLRATSTRSTEGKRIRRRALLLALDAAVVVAIVVGAAQAAGPLAEWVRTEASIPEAVARAGVIAVAAALCAPLGLGIVRTAGSLGLLLATAALPSVAPGALDLAAAPRRALVVSLQAGIVMIVGLLVVVATQPFVPATTPGLAVLGAVLVVSGVAFWRSAENLDGHVRAGAQVVVAALAKQARAPGADEQQALAAVHRLLPGLGEPVAVTLGPEHAAVGRTLAQVDLRGSTGATVLAIARGDGGVLVPNAGEVLCAGDVLALAGTHDAILAARELLAARAPAAISPPAAEAS